MHTNSNYEPMKLARIRMTRHAQIRSAQRALSQPAIQLIAMFGDRENDRNGGVRVVMTKRAMQRMRAAIGRTSQLERLRDTFIVLDAETQSLIITAGHLH